MKKGFISMLAALAVISGTVSGVIPSISKGNTVVAAEETSGAEYTFENLKRTLNEDNLEYCIYDGYASLKYVFGVNIEEFTVPETVSGLPVVGFEYGAFRDCEKLRKLNLSKNIAVVDWSAIAENSMAEITVAEDNENFTVADGVLYSKDMKTLEACPPASGKTEVKISDKTEKIAWGAFACCKTLKKIEMTDNVKEIKTAAFFGCEALESINLSNSLTHIYPYTFAGCFALKELTIPESVDTIENTAFTDAGCVVNEEGIHYVDNWAVATDPDIVRADIKQGTVGTAAGLCVSRNHLRVITVPASVKHVGMYLAFGLKMPLERVDFYCSEIPAKSLLCLYVRIVGIYDPNCKIEDNSASIPSYWKDYTYTDVEDEVEEPIEYTLSHKSVSSSSSGSHNTSVAVNTALIDIDEPTSDAGTITAFTGNNFASSNSEDLSSDRISIKEKIQNYMEKAKKKNWVVNDNSQTEMTEPAPKVYSAPIKIGNPAKYDTVIAAPKGSTAEDYALKYRRVFEDTSYNSLTGVPKTYTDADNGVTYKVYNEAAIASLDGSYDPRGNTHLKEATVSEEINGVPVTEYRSNVRDIDVIHLPKTIKTITDTADVAGDNCAYYDIDEDNPYFTSVDGIIYNKDMTKLVRVPKRYESKNIVIPDGVKIIDDWALFSLDNVESIELPDSVEMIKEHAFAFSDKLKSVKLSENLDIIGDTAFMGCTALEDITLPDSVKHIGFAAFSEVPAVETVGGLSYLDNWLVETGDAHYVTDISPREGTVGIAKIKVYAPLIVPQSVTKMSWEMVDDRSNSALTRADVYSHVLDYDAFNNARFLKDIYIYDPECEICTGTQTINKQHIEVISNESPLSNVNYAMTRNWSYDLQAGSGEKLEDTVIHGYKGSTAEAYAEMYGLKFVEIGTEKLDRGDINGSGSFNVGDLVLFNRYMHGTYKFTKPQFEAADLNGDKHVDVFDAVEFRKELLK